MTDNQVFMICGLIAWIVFIAALAWRLWLEYKQGKDD